MSGQLQDLQIVMQLRGGTYIVSHQTPAKKKGVWRKSHRQLVLPTYSLPCGQSLCGRVVGGKCTVWSCDLSVNACLIQDCNCSDFTFLT